MPQQKRIYNMKHQLKFGGKTFTFDYSVGGNAFPNKRDAQRRATQLKPYFFTRVVPAGVGGPKGWYYIYTRAKTR